MPTFTGVSAIGWQFLGQGGASERLLLLQIPSFPLPPVRKVGQMVVYQSQPFGVLSAPPVFVQGAAIWAGGVLINQSLPLLQQRNEVWAYWRQGGVPWTLTTRQ
jgi:hypothetical protein